MVTPRTMRTRVRRGAALLDERYGRLWRLLIDVDRLDMAVGAIEDGARGSCGCLLSQIDLRLVRHNDGADYGQYTEEADRLGLSERAAQAHGFLVEAASRAEAADVYEVLDELWRAEIAEPV